MAKKIKTAPIPNKIAAAVLGSVLEVEVGDEIIVWPKGSVEMLWLESRRAIVWYESTPKPKPTKTRKKGDDAAIAAFERFVDRDAKQIETELHDIKGPWVVVGPARRVDYHSTKWGRRSGYTHDLGQGVRLYRQGTGKGPFCWVLRGGKLRCTPRGLEG